MCGIAGFLLARPGRAPAECEALLWAMLAPVRHRGPDDQGVWSDGEAGLAHARLSIIDLSPAGHQPMASQDGTVWLTYNGEVYNFAELRTELAGRGYVFRSRTDSEVIANGWHAWGPELFTRLRGMFALALWDRRSRRLILARDRVGKKPLYYARTAAGIVFGSEIKALLAWPGITREPDLAAIDQYLSLQYVPAPATAFAGIHKLPPAHYLVLGADGDGEPARYWTLPAPAAHDARPVAALERELVALVDEAVRLRLVADVPLGAFLSGGVDSSTVVAAMARGGGGRVKTFSIGFTDRAYDESAYARLVADRFGTEHEELIVEPDAVAILPQLVWHYGEPFADPSAIPTWYVAAMARRHVTVALNGDGGDEAFLGYPRYRAMRHLARLDRFPASGRWALEKMLAAAPDAAARALRLAKIRAVLRAPAARPAQRYGALLAVFDDDAKQAGYAAALRGRLDGSALDLLAPYFAAADGLLAGANRADLNTYLPDDLMAKVDVATMAHGLEARSPLLDHVLLEWAARLPVATRMAGGTTKALLKSAMAPYLPAAVRSRRKQGFGMPVGRWFRGELKSLAYDTLLSQAARQRGLFRPDYVQRLLDDHCAGRADHPTRLWTLLMLELWFGMWIDAAPESAVLRPAA